MIRPIAVLILGTALAFSQDHQAMVNQHGDHVMGFSHEKTTHHFELHYDGGVIDVRANDVTDTESRDQNPSSFPTISLKCSQPVISNAPCWCTAPPFRETETMSRLQGSNSLGSPGNTAWSTAGDQRQTIRPP